MDTNDEPGDLTASPSRHNATMLLGSDRIFYTGRFRRSMKARNLGALSIYAVPEGRFDIATGDGARQSCSIVAVPPYVPHRLLPPRGPIWNLLIEPESLTDEAIESIVSQCNVTARHGMLEQLRAAEAQIAPDSQTDRFTTGDFDRLFFGKPMPVRRMDPRTITVLQMLAEESIDAMLAAETCATAVKLSASRLLHLFRQDTGISFRSCRMWKRARRFLDQTNGNTSLTEVALGLGYPDSSHFSHSIRRTFGMQPGVMRTGAHGMHIRPGADYNLFATC